MTMITTQSYFLPSALARQYSSHRVLLSVISSSAPSSLFSAYLVMDSKSILYHDITFTKMIKQTCTGKQFLIFQIWLSVLSQSADCNLIFEIFFLNPIIICPFVHYFGLHHPSSYILFILLYLLSGISPFVLHFADELPCCYPARFSSLDSFNRT